MSSQYNNYRQFKPLPTIREHDVLFMPHKLPPKYFKPQPMNLPGRPRELEVWSDEGTIVSPRLQDMDDFQNKFQNNKNTPPEITSNANRYYGRNWGRQPQESKSWDPESGKPPHYNWDMPPPDISLNEASWRDDQIAELQHNVDDQRLHNVLRNRNYPINERNPIAPSQLLEQRIERDDQKQAAGVGRFGD